MTECKSCLPRGYADSAYLGLYCEKHRKDCETVSEFTTAMCMSLEHDAEESQVPLQSRSRMKLPEANDA